MEDNQPTFSLSTRRLRYGIAALLLSVCAVAPASASHRKGSSQSQPTQTPPPAEASEPSFGERLEQFLLLVLLGGGTLVFGLRRIEKNEKNRKAKSLAIEEKFKRYEEESFDLKLKITELKRIETSLRAFAKQKLAELSTAERQLEELQSRLELLLQANPGAEDRMHAQAKKNADAELAQEREDERLEQVEKGEAHIQALLTEMKRGY